MFRGYERLNPEARSALVHFVLVEVDSVNYSQPVITGLHIV